MVYKFLLAGVGIVLGIAATLSFDGVMSATSTEEFCVSCHEMQRPLKQLQTTAHYSNVHGLSASCADCHIPRSFLPKMHRKVMASREVWGHLTGIIDTPEKYQAHLPTMRERELTRMRDNDSQECRDCHRLPRMEFEEQDRAVRRYHRAMAQRNKTCIDCHDDIAHPQASGQVSGHSPGSGEPSDS